MEITVLSEWEKVIPKPKSKFFRIKCPDCGNEQFVFSHATTSVLCNVCRAILAEPSGGKIKVKGEITDILE
ncbi:30S ribosomal protein S27e [Candidatus Bathyarchaeota archaeon]|nr:30S ribosomal protein S27e [Candidatus Bathyarchaeota archaeon]